MRPRVIPVLLLDRDRRLVKTRKFSDRVYIGDPLNVLRIFNEKEVDEICILDIDATASGSSPDIELLQNLAAECFMPISYGGGITTLQQCEHIFRAGIEKLIFGSVASNLPFLTQISDRYGSQSVCVSLDVRESKEGWEAFTHGGQRSLEIDPVTFAKQLVDAGVGEIILQNISRDGCREGYDLQLISRLSAAVDVPVVALGGAGEHDHLHEGLRAGASAVASGSAFVFIGPLRAVLLSYPTETELKANISETRGDVA